MRAARQGTGTHWLWALLPLLLAAALSIPLLDDISFNGDEPKSLRVAGALFPGPGSIPEVWHEVAVGSSEQALGWPMLLFAWGRVVGWSEVAVRALPCFAGLLTLALVYRAGRDLLAPRAGLYAALLLSGSVFFLTYLTHARAFALVALCATLCLWGYWRVALRPRPPGRGAQAGLLLGSAGLLWSHYFGALLLPALGLYHLLFVPKNRRWWRPVLLTGLAVLTAMAQLPVFQRGLEHTVTNLSLQDRALTTPALVGRLLHLMSNGTVQPQAPLDAALTLLLPAALLVVLVLRRRAGDRAGAIWLPVFAVIAFLLLVIAANEVVRAMGVSRIRYLIPLWPMVAMVAGAGLWRLAGRRRLVVNGLLALWLVSAAWLSLTTDFRHALGYFRPTDLHHLRRNIGQHVATTDLLLMDYPVSKVDYREIHSRLLGAPLRIIYRYKEDPLETARHDHAAYPYVWLLYLTPDRLAFADFPAELERVFCERALDERGFTLERHALHSVANCPELPARLEYEAGIRLAAPQLSVVDGTLRLDAHFYSEDHALLANYSLALHVIDPRSGERVAQGDTGVGPGHIVPLRSEIDLSALPAGEYALRVALYDWRDGARLPARDLETGATGDMHTLQHFRLG